MAELVLTDEEKASSSIFEWDDASIGRAIKLMVPTIFKKETKDYQSGGFMAAAVVLLALAHESNAEVTTFTIDGVTYGNKSIGDYEIRIRRLDILPVKRKDI